MPGVLTNSTNALYLAIDQGGHASRVMVFNAQGDVVAKAIREVAVSHPQPEWVEQDGDVLELSIRESLEEVAGILGDNCEAIVAAGLVTQRSNVVCWDKKTGKVLSPVISWQDRRAYQWMQQFDTQTRRIRQITGLLPTAHYGVSKLVWCMGNLPEVQSALLEKVLVWGPLSSFLLFRLLSEHPIVVDPANASRTLLWDMQQRQWSEELLTLFGISSDNLPECVPSRHNFGSLDVGGFKIPLTVCTGDQSAAIFAFGKPAQGVASINIGTGAFLQTTLTEEDIAESSEQNSSDRLLKSVVWSDEQHSIVVSEATVNGAGSAVQLFENDYDISPQTVRQLLPDWLRSGKNIPLFLNGVSGLGAPFWVPDFVSRFVGEGEPPEKMVAVIESIVFLLQVNLEEMVKNKLNIHKVIVSGGLSVLDGLCQRLADLSGLPVSRPHQCESTAKGLAFLVSGLEKSWQAGETGYVNPDIFKPESNENLVSRYRRWREELEAELGHG
jgi:glycerol kinase